MQTVRSYASLGWTSLEGQNGWHHASRILLHFQLQLPMDFWQVSLASGSPNVGLVMHLLPSRMVHPKLGFLTWDSQYSRNWMEGLGLVILTVLPPVRCTRHRRVHLLSKYWYSNYWWWYSLTNLRGTLMTLYGDLICLSSTARNCVCADYSGPELTHRGTWWGAYWWLPGRFHPFRRKQNFGLKCCFRPKCNAWFNLNL